MGRPAKVGLSPRELEVVHLLACGLSQKEIAYALGTAEPTIASHVREAKLFLRARSRCHLVALVLTGGVP